VRRLSIAAALLLALALPSLARANYGDDIKVSIFSPPQGAPASDGSSDHPVFSKDNRDVRMVAFDSSATNLVVGDSNGRRDVFVLFKARGAGEMGGRLVRVSVGARGSQGNGDSSSPSVDGTTGSAPHCIAFESRATNLAPRAKFHTASVYLHDLRRHTTTLVSAGSRSAGEPSIDGRCRTVAYQGDGWVLLKDLSSGRLLRIAPGENPDQQTDGRGVAFDSGGQVYLQRVARTRRGGLVRRGHPLLISKTAKRTPGNAASTNPAVDDHGNHVVFQSRATDLCPGGCPWHQLLPQTEPRPVDDNIFLATLRRGTSDARPKMQWLGAGQNPAITRAGEVGVFESATESAGRYYAGGARSIYRWHWFPRHNGYGLQLLTAEPPWRVPTFVFNGASMNPSVSSRGNYVAFASFGTGIFGERNGSTMSDVFMRFIGPSSEGLPTY
jgi:hypothetical protein